MAAGHEAVVAALRAAEASTVTSEVQPAAGACDGSEHAPATATSTPPQHTDMGSSGNDNTPRSAAEAPTVMFPAEAQQAAGACHGSEHATASATAAAPQQTDMGSSWNASKPSSKR